LNKYNVVEVAKKSRLRWKGEGLFNTLEERGFAIRHDFNRLPQAQSIRIYLILVAFAFTSILESSYLGQYIFAKKSIRFTMSQMFNDLIYLNCSDLFDCNYPIQFRLGGKDPPWKER
jgi:hypothetical protein